MVPDITLECLSKQQVAFAASGDINNDGNRRGAHRGVEVSPGME